MRLKQQLLIVMAAYAVAIGRSEATVSVRIFNDAARVRKLREGRDMHSAAVEDALQWLSDRWVSLEGVAWPEKVPRPPPIPSGDPGPITRASRTRKRQTG